MLAAAVCLSAGSNPVVPRPSLLLLLLLLLLHLELASSQGAPEFTSDARGIL
jgi:hypothetical protein